MERRSGAVALTPDANGGRALEHGVRSVVWGRGPGPELGDPGRDSEPSAGAGAGSGARGAQAGSGLASDPPPAVRTLREPPKLQK